MPTQARIFIYVADAKLPEFAPYIRLLAENLEQPVYLCGLSLLPVPPPKAPQPLPTPHAAH
ncbi:hypothetical protein MUN82_06380 [Hymenobacter aerilatus]|uniref:Uncharacterized protein n=1 Tax=Hymenobacter aerilatus TaxID=2932251 RepID=A0A8T9SZ90_9BACT|nr:hypothetical protein [Hymenobacter aerilatus]UOR06721.1 hypothetical protein MUN82_06380 [Hymenobacter aerilatus]